MNVQRVDIKNVRNISSASITPSPEINVLYGRNGSGKTSVLEALYMAGMARSFRGNRVKSIIQDGSSSCTVFVQTDISIGVQRELSKNTATIRISGENVQSISELAKAFPVQIINPETFSLLDGSPVERRRFIDWGVFHVKHFFFKVWKDMQQSLKQRNAILRIDKISKFELSCWDKAFIQAALVIDEERKKYIERLMPGFKKMLNQLLLESEIDIDINSITLKYSQGWDKAITLKGALEDSFYRDRQQGYTHVGPQRSDLKLMVGNINVADRFSRGQIKLLVCALKLAQIALFARGCNTVCLVLIDDLSSELDKYHRSRLCGLLQKLNIQVFITCVDESALDNCWNYETKVNLFHVEQGQVTEVSKSSKVTTAGYRRKTSEVRV